MGGSPKGNKQKKNVLCENSVEVRSNDGNIVILSAERPGLDVAEEDFVRIAWIPDHQHQQDPPLRSGLGRGGRKGCQCRIRTFLPDPIKSSESRSGSGS